MKCPKCKIENSETRKFCKNCGAKLQNLCPQCGYNNLPSDKFCGECGHSLSAISSQIPKKFSFDEKTKKIQEYLPKGLTEEILIKRNEIEGERKQVTVMFCDMVGFTPLVEKLGPDKAYAIMGQVYDILIHCVYKYEGTVNEMMGDGIMALFGAPIALEDAPQRALWSALSIHREIEKFNDQLKGIRPIKMRIGIHTGPVVVGTLGNDLSIEFKAVGDTVNLASRMEGLAESGTTYVTKENFRLTKNLFRFEALGKKPVKGKEKAVSVYKLLSEKGDVYRPRLGSERMIYSEMVGRDKELDKLELQVMKVINGKGSVVNIIGEAGIGKSRLIAELKNQDIIRKVIIIEGRAISIGRNLSFHPIIDLLKEWAGIKESDGEAIAFEKLGSAIREIYPEKIDEVLPFVATLMGMKLSGKYAERIKGIEGEALEKLILKNMRDLLTKASELTPLVIVMEDMHWADISSIELMELLFHLAEKQRILFINLFRPGHKETGDRLVETVKERLPVYYTEILVQPLDEHMGEALIKNMLNIKRRYYPIVDKIAQRADGNPFFIEEVIHSFIDEEVVVVKDGKFEMTERIDTVVIPNTINDVVMFRIDRLEEKTRDLVKVASVIGRRFYYRILTEVAKTVEDIDNRLSYLKKIQLIRKRKRMEELEYFFNHALAQEAVYESILLQKRKELHLKVAESIEKIFCERLHEFYGMLAYHYSKGEDEDKTEDYLIKAGEEALKTSASIEALHYYQDAMELYLKKYGEAADPGKIAMLERNIALALFNKGQYAEAVEHFDKALVYYGEKSPKHSISVIFKFAVCFINFVISLYLPYLKFKKLPTQRDREIILLYVRKLEALGVTDPKRFFVESVYTLKRLANFDLTKIENGTALFAGASVVFSWAGIFFGLSRKTLEFCEKRIHEDDIKSMLFYKMCALALNCVASNYEVDYYNDDLVTQNLNTGEIYPSVLYIFHQGNMNIDRGCLNDAQRMVEKLSEIADVYENDFSRTIKYELKIKLLMKCRKPYEAINEIKDGINFANKKVMNMYVNQFYAIKARLQIMLKDIQGAEEALLHAKEYESEVEPMPYVYSNFLLSKFIFDLYRLEKSIKTGNELPRRRAAGYLQRHCNAASSGELTLVRLWRIKRELREIRRRTLRSGRKMIKNVKKVACDKTEAFKLMGTYFWLIDKQKNALRWWNKSIQEGERLGARLELSRSYFEIGKRLTEPKSRHSELKGKKAEEFLEMARAIFEELDLQWDLDDLDRIIAYR